MPGRYLAVVQDDVEVDHQWIEPLIDAVERDASVGAVGSRIVLIDGTPWADGAVLPGSGWVFLVDPDQRSAPRMGRRRMLLGELARRAEAWDSVGGPIRASTRTSTSTSTSGSASAAADWSVLMACDSLVRHVRNA